MSPKMCANGQTFGRTISIDVIYEENRKSISIDWPNIVTFVKIFWTHCKLLLSSRNLCNNYQNFFHLPKLGTVFDTTHHQRTLNDSCAMRGATEPSFIFSDDNPVPQCIREYNFIILESVFLETKHIS